MNEAEYIGAPVGLDTVVDGLRITSLTGAMLAWVHEKRFDEFVADLDSEVEGYSVSQMHHDMHSAIDIVAGGLHELMRIAANFEEDLGE